MNKNMKNSSFLNFFLWISRPRRCLDSQTIRDMLLDDEDNFSDISGRGGDDSDKNKTYVLRKGLFGLSSSSEEDNLIEGKN